MKQILFLLVSVLSVFGQSRPVYYLNDNVMKPTNLTITASSVSVPLSLKLVRTDGSGQLSAVTIGDNISFDGTTLSATSTYISNNFVTNLYATNVYVQQELVTSNLYVTNIFNEFSYTSNLYTTNLYVTDTTVTSNLFVTNITVNEFNGKTTYTSNLYVTNIYAFTGVVTNDLTVYGNTYGSNVYAGNLTVSNSITGTIDGTQSGLVLKQRKSLKLQYPRRVDGSGCTYSNTNDFTAVLFMVPVFSASAATNVNYAEWAFRVPADLDTSQDLTASLTVRLGGADTSAATYTVGVVSIANSSPSAGTPANYVTLTIPADGSGADGDIESVNSVTLTGWAAALTANQWALVRLQRDGTDASAVTQAGMELEIFYVSSQ